MDRCYKCGNDVPQQAVFCPSCGARVSNNSRWDWNWRRSGSDWREPTDWWGLVTAAGFLVIILFTFARYPDVFSRIGAYLESWGTFGHPVLPPYSLGEVLIYFINACGVWGLLAATLRFVLTSQVSRSARDGVGALFSLYTAGILGQFYVHSLGGWGLVGMWIVGLVAVIIADALITIFLPRRISMHERAVQWNPNTN